MMKPIIKHTYNSVALSLRESGMNEAIHNFAKSKSNNGITKEV
ncbi:hypothetical protein [Helicobacter sp.]|nr:hypothetical protein [Helicobacter sp.]